MRRRIWSGIVSARRCEGTLDSAGNPVQGVDPAGRSEGSTRNAEAGSRVGLEPGSLSPEHSNRLELICFFVSSA
jgi:hypothetical protein